MLFLISTFKLKVENKKESKIIQKRWKKNWKWLYILYIQTVSVEKLFWIFTYHPVEGAQQQKNKNW